MIISVDTAGLKNTEHPEARNAARSTTPTLSFPTRARAPTTSIIIPRRTSIPTMTALRLHLSMMVPLNGMTIMLMNIEIEDMTPIRVLDPVIS